MSSNRKKQQFNNIDCPYTQRILDFYNSWLMYMDGEQHVEYRKIALKALHSLSDNLNDIIRLAFEENILPRLH